MGDIYNHAQEVLVWLGEDASPLFCHDCVALWTLELMAQFAMGFVDYGHQRPPSVAVEALLPFLGSAQGALLRNASGVRCSCGKSFDVNRDHRSSETLLARVANNIWTRPWFQRLWVIQETTKAASVTYHFGQHQISRRKLELAAEIYLASIENLSRKYQLYSWKPTIERIWRLLTMEIHCSEFAGQQQNLLHQILQTSDFLATEVHDRSVASRKITAGMSLMGRCADELHTRGRIYAIRYLANVQSVNELKPDYTLSPTELWKKASIFVLTRFSYREADDPVADYAPTLLLALVGTQERNAGLPSWVPDFGQVNEECRRKYQFYVREYRKFWSGGNANTLRSFEASPDSHSGSLHIQGTFHGKIIEISYGSEYQRVEQEWGTILKYDSSRENPLRSTLIPWYLQCYCFATSAAPGIKLGDTQWMQLLHHGQDVKHERLDSFNGFENAMVGEEATLESIGIDKRTLFHAMQPFLSLSNPAGRHIDSSRVMATTSMGNLGWIPNTSQSGDLVCVLRGAPFPFIVRERGDGFYTLVGDAYIQGIMHGEAWPENDDETVMIGLK